MEITRLSPVTSHKASCIALAFVATILLWLPGSTAAAADEPSLPIAEQADSGVMTATDLEQDPVLRMPVSLEATRVPLVAFLSDLHRISSIDLVAAPDAVPEKYRVTVCIQKMSLATVLNSLSQLYGVRWKKTADRQYTMLGSQLNALQTSLLKVGDPYFYRLRYRLAFNYPEQKQHKADLAAALIARVDQQALLSPGGVSFASVPKDLQEAARREVQTYTAECMLRERRMLDAATSHKFYLYFGPTPAAMPDLEGSFSQSNPGPRFSLRTEDGKMVAFVFDSLYSQIVPRSVQGGPLLIALLSGVIAAYLHVECNEQRRLR